MSGTGARPTLCAAERRTAYRPEMGQGITDRLGRQADQRLPQDDLLRWRSGRGGLRAVLHPPLDTGLKQGLIQHFEERRRLDMLEKVKKFQTITGIRNYAMYRTVIEGCCAAAEDLECVLIEVEQLAGLGLRDGEGPPGALVEDICRGQARRSSRLRSAASAAAKASRT